MLLIDEISDLKEELLETKNKYCINSHKIGLICQEVATQYINVKSVSPQRYRELVKIALNQRKDYRECIAQERKFNESEGRLKKLIREKVQEYEIKMLSMRKTV